MKLDIIDKSENLLLSRVEVNASASFEGKTTPSEENVKSEIAKLLESDSNLLVVKKIDMSYGSNFAKILAYQYISKEERDKLEPLLLMQEKKAEQINAMRIS